MSTVERRFLRLIKMTRKEIREAGRGVWRAVLKQADRKSQGIEEMEIGL